VEGILTNIRDPGWWFSVFFVGIIVSLVAAFIKDPIGNWLAHTSGWYRNRRQRASARRRARVNELAADPILLGLDTTRSGVLLSLFMFCFLAFLLIPMWSESVYSSHIFASWGPTLDREHGALFTRGLIAILGGLALCLGFIAGSAVSLTQDAYRLYRQRSRSQGDPTCLPDTVVPREPKGK
jgi:hypothetical protein